MTIDSSTFGSYTRSLNLPADSFPAFAILDVAKQLRYPFEGNVLSVNKIKAFVQDFAAGKLEPGIKSEPVPVEQEGPVTVVVAHSYKDIVLDDSKDVLVNFYAPDQYCQECKT